MKPLYKKFLAILAVLGAGTLFLARFFIKPPRTSSDFPQAEKKRLEKEKAKLEKSQSELEKKVYSDKEIEDKFNS